MGCVWCERAGGATGERVDLGALAVLPAIEAPLGGAIVPCEHVAALTDLPAERMADVLATLTRLAAGVRARTGGGTELIGTGAAEGHLRFFIEPSSTADGGPAAVDGPSAGVSLLDVARALAGDGPGAPKVSG